MSRQRWLEPADAEARREPQGDLLAERVAHLIPQTGPNFQHREVLRIAQAFADRSIPSDEADQLFFDYVTKAAAIRTAPDSPGGPL
jgi:hypothetical protein